MFFPFPNAISATLSNQATKFKFQLTGVALTKLDLNDDKTRIFFLPNVDFGEIPPFVCIKSVYIRQFWPQIIRLLPLLKQFSGNFINSLKAHLNASIGLDCTFGSGELFASPMEFASCLRKMLEIFELCSPQFTFCVNGHQRKQKDTLTLIASTLELSSVQTSENVHFLLPAINENCSWNIPYSYKNLSKEISDLKVISEWLHQPYERGSTPPIEYVRSLTIRSTEREHRLISISEDDVVQLIDDLKLVSFLFKF